VTEAQGSVGFGRFRLLPQRREVRADGVVVQLGSRAFDILIVLTEARGALVTKDELLSRVWPDTVVEENNLVVQISALRKALGEDRDFIRTVSGLGYRFVAELITPVGETIVETPADRGISAEAAPKVRSIAVLPLENLSDDPSQEYFADGMTDELITTLAQISSLRVISRTSIMTYKRVRKLLPEIARELNVEAVVEGTVLRFGDRVRITAQLIQLPVERHMWAQSFEGDLRDTLALQNSVARTIAEQIRATVTQQEQATLQNSKPVNPVAYEAYLKGRYFLNKRTGDGLKTAIEYFNLATDDDPNYAKAYTGLADAYALSGDWEYGLLSPQDAFSKAKAAATRALGLDDSLAEAHTSLAFILDLYAWDWFGADKEYERAIALYPGYATAHHWYAWHLIVTGRIDAGIAELRKAESLDPLSLIIGADLADALCIAHLYDEAVLQSRKTLKMDPNFAVAHYELGQALSQERRHDEAIVEFKRAIELSGADAIFVAKLANVYAAADQKENAMKIISDLKEREHHSASVEANIALIYVGLGNNNEAMVWLNKAYQARFNPSILLRPAFGPLRSDVRFQDLLRRIGLPQLAPDTSKPPI
jgi:TolB-like protein/Flp pilus assembly protein TadD